MTANPYCNLHDDVPLLAVYSMQNFSILQSPVFATANTIIEI